jgi:hypothetical protein
MKAHDRDHLDEWLDIALQQYGNAEPRLGLESRILGSMEAARERAVLGRPFGWLFAAASLAVVLIAIFIGIWHRPLAAPQRVAGQQTGGNAVPQSGVQTIPAARPRHTGTKLPLRRQTHLARAELAREPKLEQFPSPRPLSEQELLLTRYAKRFPTEARLIAQEQDKFQQEIQQAEQEMKHASPDSEQ